MSISVACVLEIARAIDVLVHSAGNKRPGKSFIESCKDQSSDSKDKTGIGSEAMKDRGDVPTRPCDGKFDLHLVIMSFREKTMHMLDMTKARSDSATINFD